MQTTERAAKRPFHETIVEAIGSVDSFDELRVLAKLIRATKIPMGHDEIIAAWNQHLEGYHFDIGTIGDDDVSGVLADLLEKKEEAAEKEKEQAGATS